MVGRHGRHALGPSVRELERQERRLVAKQQEVTPVQKLLTACEGKVRAHGAKIKGNKGQGQCPNRREGRRELPRLCWAPGAERVWLTLSWPTRGSGKGEENAEFNERCGSQPRPRTTIRARHGHKL